MRGYASKRSYSLSVTDAPSPTFTRNNAVAIITGAAGSIGAATARSFVNRGVRVALIDMSENKLTALCAELGELALPFAADLSDIDTVEKVACEILLKVDQVDILINNAGILSNNKIAETDIHEWRRVQTVNVEAALMLTKAVLPGMRARKSGRIVNISSYAAKSGGLTAGTAYSVSKSAMLGLTFATARETTGDGITVNAIAPAYVMSPMISEQLTQEQRDAQKALIPVGRFCEPEEVAHTIEFLVSPLAGFITGEVIDMNGGLHFD
jgi:3-oxoacyl-[acyl-carrier protein] reductase